MIYEKNISRFVEYFESGCKKEQLIGIELEHFVLDRAREAVTYEGGVKKILQQIQPKIGAPIFSDGQIIGISGADYVISLEPAAQLEISINPSADLDWIRATYDDFSNIISPVLHETGCELFCGGYQPVSSPENLPLIPKKRYELMYEYFKSTGSCGTKMMRGTASTQINIDYENENDFIKKFHVANILSPFFAKKYDTTGKMLRAKIWQNVDPARTRAADFDDPSRPSNQRFENSLSRTTKSSHSEKNFGFADYANFLMQMPPIFLPVDGELIYTNRKTVAELFSERLLSHDDIEHVTTMAFPDVRLKNRLEIRVADSMPICEVIEFAALLKKIFYDEATLEKIFRETRAGRVPNADCMWWEFRPEPEQFPAQ